MDIAIAVAAGLFFSVLTAVMLFFLVRNARKGIVCNRAYLIPCFSAFLSLPSFFFLNFQIQKCDAYVQYLCVGAALCIMLSVCLYVLLRKLDRGYIREQYPADVAHINTPWYYIAICSVVSAVLIAVLLGWLVNICFREPIGDPP